MQAVILAAGYGRRMGRLSESCHKALLSVAGTTILGRIMDGLCAIDVSSVTVVTGYRAAAVEAFIRERYPMVDLRVVHNDRVATTNNIVSLSLALEVLDYAEDLLLLECDVLFDPSLLVRLVSHPAGNVALVDRYRTGMDGTVVTISDGLIAEVFPPASQGPGFSYDDKFKTLNVYRFTRQFARHILAPAIQWHASTVDADCYYEVVLNRLTNLREHRIAAEVVDGDRWVEVDDPNDLAAARFRFEPQSRGEVLDRSLGGYWNFDVLDFTFMRNAYFPTDAMYAAMRSALADLVRNYGSSQSVLNEKLSYFLGCDLQRLQVLHGAAQAFPILRRLLGGRTAVLPSPTFGEYGRVFPGAVTYDDGPGVDWAAVERLIEGPVVLVVVNPNNPTGTTLDSERVHDLARRHPGATVLVDESFAAFTPGPTVVDHLEREPLANVVVLTSLSKSMGVPGLRLGYLYCSDPAMVRAVGEELPVWNLSAPAEFLLELLLKFRDDLHTSIQRTLDDRATLEEDLNRVAVVDQVYPSGGNFLLVRLAGRAPDMGARVRSSLLEKAAIAVKDVSARFPDGAPRLRVAVRSPADNAQLVRALGQVVWD